MANVVYPIALKAFLDGNIDLLSDDIRVILVDTDDYTYSAAHEFLDDIPAGARVSVSASLTGKSTTGGVFDADNAVFASVAGDTSEAIVIYQHTGVEGTSNLIAYFDTMTGLPVTPNGTNINLTWDAGADKIFSL